MNNTDFASFVDENTPYTIEMILKMLYKDSGLHQKIVFSGSMTAK